MGSSLLLWGILKKQNNIKSVAAVVLTIMAIIAIPVYLTGEPAEESVEKLPAVSDAMLELHEEAATIAIWLMGIAGVLSLAALFLSWQQRKSAGMAFIIAFVFSAISFAAMARTGYYGGQIRHSEIRVDNTSNQPNVNEQQKEGENKTENKDDD